MTLAQLDARSDALLGLVPGIAGMVVPVPASSAACVALGYPAPSLLLNCNEPAGNLIDAVAAAELAAQAGALQGRAFQGVATAADFWSKAAVETPGRFQATANVAGDVALEDFTFSLLFRSPPVTALRYIFGKWTPAGIGWMLYENAGNYYLWLQDGTGGAAHTLLASVPDGGAHLLTVAVDRDGQIQSYLDAIATASVAASKAGSLANAAAPLVLGARQDASSPSSFQHAWVYLSIGTAASRTGHDALWKHALAAGLAGTANGYVRANPIRVAGASNRVFGYGAGQVPFGYDAAFEVSDGDPLETGVVYEDGISFLGINSADLNAWTNFGTTTHAPVDGPSSMRDAIRVTSGGAWAPNGAQSTYSPAATLTGATNVPHAVGVRYKRGISGATGRIAVAFNGDPGGGEIFAFLTDNAVPDDWTKYFGVLTPTRAAHTTVQVMCGADGAANDCDFAEPYAIQNRAADALAHRATAAGAAQATSTPVHTIANVGNVNYRPAKGRVRLRLANAQPTDGATFLACGLAAAKGALVLDRAVGGNLRLRVWDNTPALVATVDCGALDTTQHVPDVAWNAAAGTLSVKEGATVLGSYSGAAWTPSAVDVTPLYVGSNNGANAARAFIGRVQWFSF